MFGYIVDMLQSYQLSETFLSLMLIMMIVLVIACFLRQIVGLTGYMIVYPLLMALIRYIYGTVFVMTVVWRIGASLLTGLILKIIFVLEWVKYSIMLCLYVIIILGIGVMAPEWVRPFWTNEMLLAQIITIITVQHVVWDVSKINIHTAQVLWHAIITALIYYVLFQWKRLHGIVLTYPDITIWVSLILIIAIWRYTGLQMVEILRFYPLIKYRLRQQTEEEE